MRFYKRLTAEEINLRRAESEVYALEKMISIAKENLSIIRADAFAYPLFFRVKACFFCAEGIRFKAKVCKNCKRIQPESIREIASERANMEIKISAILKDLKNEIDEKM